MEHGALQAQLPDLRLKALWLALDTDCSGYLSSGEFGAFMNMGAPPGDPAVKAKEAIMERKKKKPGARKRERQMGGRGRLKKARKKQEKRERRREK